MDLGTKFICKVYTFYHFEQFLYVTLFLNRTPHLRETKIDNQDTRYHKTPDTNRIDHPDINRNRDVSIKSSLLKYLCISNKKIIMSMLHN